MKQAVNTARDLVTDEYEKVKEATKAIDEFDIELQRAVELMFGEYIFPLQR